MKHFKENYIIDDLNNGVFPDTPEIKMENGYQEIIDRIPEMKTIFDFIQVFNSTGLRISVNKSYSFTDGNREFSFSINFSMFGTRIDSNNSDEYPECSDTGVFAIGPSSSWDSEIHIYAEDNIWHGYEDYCNDIRNFYNREFDLPGVPSQEDIDRITSDYAGSPVIDLS